MQVIEFAGEWHSFFTEYGFSQFEDFFRIQQGDIVNQNKKRRVIRFSLGEDGDEREFFIKQFEQPHFKDMWFAFCNCGRINSQAGVEWDNANVLLGQGIGTYVPVCYGSRMSGPVEKQSFFVTEKLTGECMTDIVSQRWGQIGRGEKEELMAEVGRTVRRLHDAGISFPDLYVWHVFVEQDENGYDLSLIDLHRMKTKTGRKFEEFTRNLGAFDFSLREEYFDDRLRDVFFDAYVGDGLAWDADKFRAKVKARSAVLAGRRRREKY